VSTTGKVLVSQLRNVARSRWILGYGLLLALLTWLLLQFGGSGERALLSLLNVVLLLLPALRSTEALTVFAVVFGLADFSTVAPTTALARRAFPDGGWALVLGLIGFTHQVGSALGGALGGALYDATGGYGTFFVGAAATCVAAAVLSMQIGRAPTSRVGRRLPEPAAAGAV